MEKLSTITEMQNVLNRAYKLDLYEILKISDTLFDDIEKLRYLAIKSARKKVIYREELLNDNTFYITECPNCRRSLNDSELYDYCPNCGQRLDWSE